MSVVVCVRLIPLRSNLITAYIAPVPKRISIATTQLPQSFVGPADSRKCSHSPTHNRIPEPRTPLSEVALVLSNTNGVHLWSRKEYDYKPFRYKDLD